MQYWVFVGPLTTRGTMGHAQTARRGQEAFPKEGIDYHLTLILHSGTLNWKRRGRNHNTELGMEKWESIAVPAFCSCCRFIFLLIKLLISSFVLRVFNLEACSCQRYGVQGRNKGGCRSGVCVKSSNLCETECWEK